MTFIGYPPARGAPGIRNHVAIISVEVAADPVAARIADEVLGRIGVQQIDTCFDMP